MAYLDFVAGLYAYSTVATCNGLSGSFIYVPQSLILEMTFFTSIIGLCAHSIAVVIFI
jgi:hypothetical protein